MAYQGYNHPPGAFPPPSDGNGSLTRSIPSVEKSVSRIRIYFPPPSSLNSGLIRNYVEKGGASRGYLKDDAATPEAVRRAAAKRGAVEVPIAVED